MSNNTGPTRCPVCLRTKEEAIRDHLRDNTPCDNPDCIFCNEINQAIAERKARPKFTFGQIKRPAFTFGTPSKGEVNNE